MTVTLLDDGNTIEVKPLNRWTCEYEKLKAMSITKRADPGAYRGDHWMSDMPAQIQEVCRQVGTYRYSHKKGQYIR